MRRTPPGWLIRRITTSRSGRSRGIGICIYIRSGLILAIIISGSRVYIINTLKTLSRDIIHSTISTLRDSFGANRTFHIQIRNGFTFNRTFHHQNFEIKRLGRSDATYNLEAKSGQKTCYNLTKLGNKRTNLKGANDPKSRSSRKHAY